MLGHFILGVTGSFFGGIPFGTINLAVVDMTLQQNRRSGARFAIGASIVEIGEAGVAVLLGEMITVRLDASLAIKIVVVVFIILFGLYFILKRDSPDMEKEQTNHSPYIRGLVVSSRNLLAIPYWIFVLAIIQSYDTVQLQGEKLIVFLTGAGVGKYFILSIFGILSNYLNAHMQQVYRLVNKFTGTVLILIGLIIAYYLFF